MLALAVRCELEEQRLEPGALGGTQVDEWHARAQRLAGKSKARGMTPIFVVYAIGGNTDSAQQVWQNTQDANYLRRVFTGLRDVAETADDLIAHLRTTSHYFQIDPAKREAFEDEDRRLIEAHGGVVHSSFATVLMTALRSA